MTTVKVTPIALEAIRSQSAARDRAAFMLGVALAEYEISKRELAGASRQDADRLLRLGALQHEFDKVKETFLGSIDRALAERKKIAEAALNGVGLGMKERSFTIDEKTGDVLELIAGAYVPVEKK